MGNPATARPALLLRGLLVDRRRPDLAALAAETNPERFLWSVLPHAARSFAASIVVLPAEQARAAAVGYLYCRMLDSYEDLLEDPVESSDALGAFAERLYAESPEPAATIPATAARERYDDVYLLLIERSALIDSVFAQLPERAKTQIRDLVTAMAAGMIWSKQAFTEQGGVLIDERQLAYYCHSVIGHPTVFMLHLLGREELNEGARADALAVSEMIQLANVTRDIEADLARGVGYHPALRPHLGTSGYEPGSREIVRDVREELLATALGHAPAYRRLFDRLDLGETAAVRTAAVLMLRFTDLYYRSCASRTGNRAWPGPRSSFGVVAGSLPAAVSTRWAKRAVRGVEERFVAAAAGIAEGAPALRPDPAR